MSLQSVALAHNAEQARITEAAVRAAALLWREIDPHRVSASWEFSIGDRILRAVSTAQLLAAASADAYADLSLTAQDQPIQPEGQVIPAALAGVASDGRDLASLLLQPVITTAVARAGGATPASAMSAGLGSLTRIVGTQVQDAGRAASSISTATRYGTGFVRIVNPGACGRCAILAGRFYRWNASFDRHPLCGCTGIPAAEDTSDSVLTDPVAYFHSLGHDEQDRAFTKAGAQAIRDGADISQVVNARRGALGLSTPGSLAGGGRVLQRTDVHGRLLTITTEGTTKRGVAGRYLIKEDGARASQEVRGTRLITRERSATPRLMPEAIYEIAKDREDAVRLLSRYGYITDRLYADARAASAAAKSAEASYLASRASRGLSAP